VLKANVTCRPCYRRECRYGHYDCLKGITTENVLERTLALA
jgi:heptosyltransferase-2